MKTYINEGTSLTAWEGGRKVLLSVPGNCPSFKNRKQIFRFGNKLSIGTEKKIKARMEAMIQRIVSLYLHIAQTEGGSTWTGSLAPSWMSSLPQDDNCQCVVELRALSKSCAKGEERTVIVIEKLPPATGTRGTQQGHERGQTDDTF